MKALARSSTPISLISADNIIDPFSQKKVSDIALVDRLVISNEKNVIIVDSNYIIYFIESQLNQDQLIFEIYLNGTKANGSPISIVLNNFVWYNCLLRQHKSNNIK